MFFDGSSPTSVDHSAALASSRTLRAGSRRPFGIIYERRPAETEHKFKQLQSRERVAALSHEAAVPLLRAMDNTGDARICF